jgi:AcrR family transcriptional regulator
MQFRGGIIITNLTDKSAFRRNQILQASQELFNIKGFQETSINDIMKKVGAAKGGFYYYFETKEQILDVLVDQNTDAVVNAMIPIVEDLLLNPFDKLKFMLSEEIKTNLQNNTSTNHLHNIKNVDMHQKILIAMVKKLSPIMSKVIEQGMHEGIFKVNHPLEISEILITGVHFILDSGIFRWTKEQYFQKIKAAEELIEKALCIEEGSFSFLSGLLINSIEGNENNE